VSAATGGFISAFDIFKIGIGPSSSHTVGPMIAARRFLDEIGDLAGERITVDLFGSLAWTGRGHATDMAICLGLLGETPASIEPEAVPALVAGLNRDCHIGRPDGMQLCFDPEADIRFDLVALLPTHSNAMRFRLLARDGQVICERDYFSVGGGFVTSGNEPAASHAAAARLPFTTAAELLDLCRRNGLTIAEVQAENELDLRDRPSLDGGLDSIRDTMFACIERGLAASGELPGPLRVRKRAHDLFRGLQRARLMNKSEPHHIMDWVSTFAIAVNEENASGGRIVTAPTNGAAGTLPAVLRYFRDFCPDYSGRGSRTFLLTAAAIGGLIKRNASLSGAEVGCQGEVGAAASMAAAGLAAGLGATAEQIENAAEIAMEHHLGMTCDPIGGLVQIPCIERNAFGAIKAIAAASLALRGDGRHQVTFDRVIETMRQTGHDMQSQYKETSRGGLAVNVPDC
jgi:L-serine dehydratase